MRTWSLYIADAKNSYASHDGYDDDPRAHYVYDNLVPNSRRVEALDLAIIRGRRGALGAAFIQQVDERPGVKLRRRCRACETFEMERRKTVRPTFRCIRGHVFDDPIVVETPVTEYRADFPDTFVEAAVATAEQLDRLCVAQSRQNAIRELALRGTLLLLQASGLAPTFTRAQPPARSAKR